MAKPQLKNTDQYRCRLRFHLTVEIYLSLGYQMSDSFALCWIYSDRKAFLTYANYKAWKSSNNESYLKKYAVTKPREFQVIKDEPLPTYNNRLNNKLILLKEVELSSTIKLLNYKYRVCKCCNELFDYSGIKSPYCSIVCKSYKPPTLNKCKHCGDSYIRETNGGYTRYCSSVCFKNNKRDVKNNWRRKTKRSCSHRERAKKYGKMYESVNLTKLFKEENYTCYLCNNKLKKVRDSNKDVNQITVDHIIPLSDSTATGLRHGHNVRYNMRCCCFKCNISKGVSIINSYQSYFWETDLTNVNTQLQLKL
tara:strand:+ start:13 stop:936 length:924 start_codon:yes stop_codon:yes gene_type:complete